MHTHIHTYKVFWTLICMETSAYMIILICTETFLSSHRDPYKDMFLYTCPHICNDTHLLHNVYVQRVRIFQLSHRQMDISTLLVHKHRHTTYQNTSTHPFTSHIIRYATDLTPNSHLGGKGGILLRAFWNQISPLQSQWQVSGSRGALSPTSYLSCWHCSHSSGCDSMVLPQGRVTSERTE